MLNCVHSGSLGSMRQISSVTSSNLNGHYSFIYLFYAHLHVLSVLHVLKPQLLVNCATDFANNLEKSRNQYTSVPPYIFFVITK